MKRILWVLPLAVVSALGGQEPQVPDSTRAAELRAEVERRFATHVRRELGLSDDQAVKLGATQERFRGRRLPIQRRQRNLRLALDDQMRPGVAADADSVRKLMDAVQTGRAELLKIDQDEDREMAAYLTPVQRARFQMLRQRFVQRVQDVRRERRGLDGPRRRPPGRRPGRVRG
ncbi:MAG TPA: hypothetical protein VGA20_01335 [Gemmatimonadales bacterium]